MISVKKMLLIPNKNAHPDLTVISVSSFILCVLRKERVQSYTDLYARLSSHNGRAVYLFSSSLELLFLLGLINYHVKNDTLEYIGK